MTKEIMRASPTISASAIAEQVGLSADGVNYYIRKMKSFDEIERESDRYGGRWKVNN